MYGAGHIMDMINRMKQNRAQRPSTRAKFKENNREAIYTTRKKEVKPYFKTVSKEKLTLIKHSIRRSASKQHTKERLYFRVFIACCFILTIILLLWLK